MKQFTIDRKRWIKGQLTKKDDRGQYHHCAMGFMVEKLGVPNDISEEAAFPMDIYNRDDYEPSTCIVNGLDLIPYEEQKKIAAWNDGLPTDSVYQRAWRERVIAKAFAGLGIEVKFTGDYE